MFSTDDFEQAVSHLAEPATDLGFTDFNVISKGRVSVRLQSVSVTFELERGSAIVARVQFSKEFSCNFQEISDYCEGLHRPAVCIVSRDQAESIINGMASRLSEMVGSLLNGEARLVEELQEWTEVSRGLSTQHYTNEARSPERWSLIVSAWREKRYASVIRLLQSLPAPLTNAEESAVQFARKQTAT